MNNVWTPHKGLMNLDFFYLKPPDILFIPLENIKIRLKKLTAMTFPRLTILQEKSKCPKTAKIKIMLK